jgi:ankyrin repeat protein
MDGQVSGGEGSMMPTGIGPDGSDKARLAAMEALLAAGAEVDAQNGDGYTALHLASLAIKPKLVAALLEAGARVDLATVSHKTALECAEQFADKDAGASAECVRLIEAREKELGLEGRGAGSCFWCCFILKPANICQDRLGPNIGKEDEKRRFCRRRGEVYYGRDEHQRQRWAGASRDGGRRECE